MSQNIDLHCHSSCSDGALSPTELVSRAAEKGVSVLALTDHDTTKGVAEAEKKAAELSMKLIPGVEFSCLWGGATVHILGLGVSIQSQKMIDAVLSQDEVRRSRAIIIAEKLHSKYKMSGLLDGIESIAGNAIPARPHIAKKMVQMGYVASVREAFNTYLGAGKVGDVKVGWPEIDQVVDWIIGSGGVAVVAHPRKYKFTLSKLRRLFDDFSESGGQSIEVSVGGQKQGETGLLADLCCRYDFYASAGSDFHSPGSPWSELGKYPKLPSNVTPVWDLLLG